MSNEKQEKFAYWHILPLPILHSATFKAIKKKFLA